MLKVKPRAKVEKSMGLTYVPVTIRASQQRRKHYTARFLVDCGAVDTMVPAAELKRIGIKPLSKTQCELADMSVVEYDFGLAVIELLGEVTAGRVIFGPDDCEPLLGVTVLESMGVVIDPKSEKLKKLPALPLK
jgi:clan AA aspartic protease